jgi:glycosyltransferase involved in cell wall biosynthesis
MVKYPVGSETFVVEEIAALRELGAEVMTVAFSGQADVVLDRWRARNPAVAVLALLLLLRRPRALGCLLRGPFNVGLRVKLLAAASIARQRRINAVHAHFVWRSADAAEVIGCALGTGHSVTAHANDIFVTVGPVARRLAAAKTVITVCEYNRRWLVERHPGEVAGKLHVVPCCTRVEVEPTRPLRDEGGQLVILGAGRLVPKKGFDVLVRAMPHLQHDAVVVIVGEGPERARLEGLASDLGVAGRIVFAGWSSHEGMQAHYAAADVFCLPCRVAPDGDRDSMPVVVKEAMAAGLPIVSTVEVGVPEMVDDGDNGLLVPPDDHAALAGALGRLLGDPVLRARMGRRGHEIVAERFDLRDQAIRLLKLFTDVAPQSAMRPRLDGGVRQ